jgi:hypothetical protein
MTRGRTLLPLDVMFQPLQLGLIVRAHLAWRP